MPTTLTFSSKIKIYLKRFNFFENLKKATGITINLQKTTLLPINTDDKLQIQITNPQISIKEQYEPIKILGIIINEDLKFAKEQTGITP